MTPDKTMATTAYTGELQQHLINNQLYPGKRVYLSRSLLLLPANLGDIPMMFFSVRSSGHSSSSLKVDFDDFCLVNSRAADDTFN